MLEGSCLCGAVRWRLDGHPPSATACSCTACRRYGTLWAYGWEDEDVHFSGETVGYVRGDSLGFHFCPACGCIAGWRGLAPNAQGRRRVAVNLRLTEPGPIADVPIRHFDGLDTWSDLPADGRCVRDHWF
jgi:hypothetical protein